jgi:hypothetical protein
MRPIGEPMRGMALVVALFSLPASAADYLLGPGREPAPTSSEWLELAQQGDRCCKRCTKANPCGNTCISTKSKCQSLPRCAC